MTLNIRYKQTAARRVDIQLLDKDYKVTAVVPVDMFPQTAHVENIIRLDRRV